MDEFIKLVSDNFTFVDNWSSPSITPSTYGLYSKKITAKKCGNDHIERV